MLLGRPVGATPVGWVPELVEDGVSGRVVPAGDAEALAGALADLLGDPAAAARLGEEGRRRAEAAWSPDRLVSLVEDAYRATLGAG
jgi:glycosyltransferase involved in cell wall biosynthesis